MNDKFIDAEDRHKFISKCENYIYHVSIIDYLQQWDFSKKGEKWLKTNIKREDKD